jgi:hypothetical protein
VQPAGAGEVAAGQRHLALLVEHEPLGFRERDGARGGEPLGEDTIRGVEFPLRVQHGAEFHTRDSGPALVANLLAHGDGFLEAGPRRRELSRFALHDGEVAQGAHDVAVSPMARQADRLV